MAVNDELGKRMKEYYENIPIQKVKLRQKHIGKYAVMAITHIV